MLAIGLFIKLQPTPAPLALPRGAASAPAGWHLGCGGRLTSAAIRADLTAVKVGGKTQPQFAKSLGAARYPEATFTLTRPVTLSPIFASGATIRVTR